MSRTKSLVLGLALWKGTAQALLCACAVVRVRVRVAFAHILRPWTGPFSVDQCIAASRIEEDHNIAEWGECEGAHDLDKVDIYKHVAAATAFLRSLPKIINQ